MRTKYTTGFVMDFHKDSYYVDSTQLFVYTVVDFDSKILFFVRDSKDPEFPYTCHKCKVYTTNSGRSYFRYKNSRVYLNECKKG